MEKTRRSRPVPVEHDLTPFMNLMVVLIPILLLSTEFARVSIIDATCSKRGANQDTTDTVRRIDTTRVLGLVAVVTDTTVVVGSDAGFLPTIRYREFHRYRSVEDGSEFTVPAGVRSIPPRHPRTQREFTPAQRQEILLYLCREGSDSMATALHTRDGLLVTNSGGEPASGLRTGDPVFVGGDPRYSLVVTEDLRAGPVRVPAALVSLLNAIRARYPDAKDKNQVTIAAEGGIIYEKLIAFMDVLREEHFEVSIARLRS